MRRSQSIAVVTIAFIAWVILTWLVIKTPGQSQFPSPVLDDSKPAIESASSPVAAPGENSSSASAVIDAKVPIVPKAPVVPQVPVVFSSPALNDTWLFGEPHTIRWSSVAGRAGGLYLVSAADGTVTGWIVQQLGPGQTSSPWDTRFVLESRTSALKKEVVPGRYFIKIIFDSGAEPTVSSKSFFVAPSG